MCLQNIVAGAFAPLSLFDDVAGSNCRPQKSSSAVSSGHSSAPSSSPLSSPSSVPSSSPSSAPFSGSSSPPSSSPSSSPSGHSFSPSSPSSSPYSSPSSYPSSLPSPSSPPSSPSSSPSASPTPICFNIIAQSPGNDHIDGGFLVVQNGITHPFFGMHGDVWVEAVRSLTPEGYLQQQGDVNHGAIFGYYGYPHIIMATFPVFIQNGVGPAICALNTATSSVECTVSVGGYGPELFSAIPSTQVIDYLLYWMDRGGGVNNSPATLDGYLPATMKYVEVECPLTPDLKR